MKNKTAEIITLSIFLKYQRYIFGKILADFNHRQYNIVVLKEFKKITLFY